MVDARQFEFVSNTRSRGHKLKFCIIWREFPQGIWFRIPLCKEQIIYKMLKSALCYTKSPMGTQIFIAVSPKATSLSEECFKDSTILPENTGEGYKKK